MSASEQTESDAYCPVCTKATRSTLKNTFDAFGRFGTRGKKINKVSEEANKGKDDDNSDKVSKPEEQPLSDKDAGADDFDPGKLVTDAGGNEWIVYSCPLSESESESEVSESELDHLIDLGNDTSSMYDFGDTVRPCSPGMDSDSDDMEH